MCLGAAWGGPAEWQGHGSRTRISPPPNLCILQWSLSPQHCSAAQAPNPGIILTSFSHTPRPIQWQTCWLHSLPLPLLAALPFLEHKYNPNLRPLQLLFPLPETLHYKGGRQILLIPFRSLLKRHLLREVFSKPLYWLPLWYPLRALTTS